MEKQERIKKLIHEGKAIQQKHEELARVRASQGSIIWSAVKTGSEGFDKWIGDVKTTSSRYFIDHPLHNDLNSALFLKDFPTILGLLESIYLDEDYFVDTSVKLCEDDSYQIPQKWLPKNSYDVLVGIVESKEPAKMLAKQFKGLSKKEDAELRAVLRELVEKEFIDSIKWADNVPFSVDINNSTWFYVSKLKQIKTIDVTPAEVNGNMVTISIRSEIYEHIKKNLGDEDYFHAVEESFKFVRRKLKELTESDRASDAFAEKNNIKIFGHEPDSDEEKDFFKGVKFLNMAIQYFRNEKSHICAYSVNQNLALHYIALASLAYDLIGQKNEEGGVDVG